MSCLAGIGADRIALRDCITHWRGRMFGIPAELYFDPTGQLVQPPVIEVRDGQIAERDPATLEHAHA